MKRQILQLSAGAAMSGNHKCFSLKSLSTGIAVNPLISCDLRDLIECCFLMMKTEENALLAHFTLTAEELIRVRFELSVAECAELICEERRLVAQIQMTTINMEASS